MWRRPGACTIAALLAWENRGQRSWASLPVSAMGDLSASRRSPRLRFACGAAGLWCGPEAVGRADALIETSHTRASIAEKGGRVPRDLRKSALSEKTSMCGGDCAIMQVDVDERVVGQRRRAGQAKPHVAQNA
jgi:hypothetical protein